MKLKYDVINKRRDEVLDLIKSGNKTSIEEIAEKFNVSSLTARRDINYLLDQGKITKDHGRYKSVDEVPVIKKDPFLDIKIALAKKAAEFINDGDTIFINSYDIVNMIISYLEDKFVTVIGNNASIMAMKCSPNVSVCLTGGQTDYINGPLVGQFALNNLSRVNADIAILGCDGIDFKAGVTTDHLQEVEVFRMMNMRSKKTILVTDWTHIGNPHNFICLDNEDINVLITDNKADQHQINQLEKIGIEIVKVNP